MKETRYYRYIVYDSIYMKYQNMQIYSDRKQMGGWRQQGERMKNGCLMGGQIPFRGDENAQELDSGDGWTPL